MTFIIFGGDLKYAYFSSIKITTGGLFQLSWQNRMKVYGGVINKSRKQAWSVRLKLETLRSGSDL